MELKLKQRIIGVLALAIVALIAIIILSDRGHSPNESGLAAGIPAPEPLKLNMPSQQQAATTTTPSDAIAQAATQAPVNAVMPAQKNIPPAPTSSAATPPVVIASSTTTPVTKTTKTTTKTHAKTTAVAKKPPITHAKHSAGSHAKLAPAKLPDAWSIKLGVFSKQANADKLVKELRVKGYRAYIQKEKASKQVFYRVFVGPELKREKAQQVVMKIQKSFRLKGEIVKYKV